MDRVICDQLALLLWVYGEALQGHPQKRALNQPDSKTLLSPNSARLALHLEYMDL